MRWTVLILGLALGACSKAPTSGSSEPVTIATQSAQQAYFSTYPGNLFFAAEAVCDRPGQSVVKPSRDEVRCESLPDPESAAALILQFDGTVEDLPRFVITFSGEQTEQGYLVTADNFVRVPQRNGAARLIRFPDEGVKAEMAELLAAAGGRPL